MNRLILLVHLIKNMGLHYVLFRLMYELKLNIGWMKKIYPSDPPPDQSYDLENWKMTGAKFFFESKEKLKIEKDPSDQLLEDFEKIGF